MGQQVGRIARVVLPALAGVALFFVYRGYARGAGMAACPASDSNVVVVDTASHTLFACENGHGVGRFGVRIGRSGTGKAREGDGKTPLGTYPLGEARPSASYGTFVPIGYPTPEQRRAGRSGSDVGLHGPGRRMRAVGALANLFDTTDGCVGLGTDDDMDRFASWVRLRRPRTIVLR